MATFDEAEVRATYQRYIETRGRIQAGDLKWSALADFFTEDAVFIDPAWGRVEGIDELIAWFDESMQGLGDWTFPEEWTMVDGDRLVSFWWNRLPGADEEGRPHQAAGLSILRYAGDGRFYYEHDLLNMAEVGEVLAAAGWTPSGDFNMPPRRPNRDISPPAGRDG
jgi:ketosteroid isomerase-like protein